MLCGIKSGKIFLMLVLTASLLSGKGPNVEVIPVSNNFEMDMVTALTMSKHNFYSYDMNAEDEGASCISCHAPSSNNGQTALWSSNDGFINSYDVSNEYEEVSSSSKMCMSCHDTSIDLDHSHPVGVSYLNAYASGGYTAPSADLYLSDRGTVECSSCHDPHNDQYGNFLRKSNSGSQLCLNCHIK